MTEAELGGRLAKLQKKFDTELATALTKATAPLLETIAQLTEKVTAIAAAGSGGAGGGSGGAGGGAGGSGDPKDIENHPAFKGALQKIEALTKANKDATEAAAAEKKANRDAGRSRTLRESVLAKLAEAGIEGRRALQAAGLLIDAEKCVGYSNDDDDDLVFRGKKPEDDVDLDTGLSTWLKTEDAKIFLPPRGASGSGDRGGGRGPGGKGQGGKLERGDLGRAILGLATALPTVDRE